MTLDRNESITATHRRGDTAPRKSLFAALG